MTASPSSMTHNKVSIVGMEGFKSHNGPIGIRAHARGLDSALVTYEVMFLHQSGAEHER